MSPKSDLPHGTLDVLILQTLHLMGSLHGYALARRIEQIDEGIGRLSQGSVYPALIRLQQQGWVATEWGTSETGRKVKFYSLTRAGERQLKVEVANWERSTAMVAKFLGARP